MKFSVSILLGFALFASDAVRAQDTDRLQTLPAASQPIENAFEDMRRVMSKGMIYRNLCDELSLARRSATEPGTGSILDDLRTDDSRYSIFLKALADFCISGKFLADFGTSPSAGTCESPYKLNQEQVELLSSLDIIRPRALTGAKSIFSLTCAEAATLAFRNFDVSELLLSDLTANTITIENSNIHNGIALRRVTVKSLLRIQQIQSAAEILVLDSTIGTAETNAKSHIFSFERNNALSLRVVRTALYGSFVGNGTSLSHNANFNFTRIGDLLYLYGIRVGGQLLFTGGPYETIDIRHARARTVLFSNTEVKTRVSAEYVTAENLLLIEKNSKLAIFNAHQIRTTQLRVSNAFIKSLETPSANAQELKIEHSEIGDLQIWDSRLQVLQISDTTFSEGIDCSDCKIAQYALLEGTFSALVNLRGMEINGRLMFSLGGARPKWKQDAVLDLRGSRIQNLSVDQFDLELDETGSRCKGHLVPVRMAGSVIQSITPARYTQSNELALLDRPAQSLAAWLQGGVSCEDENQTFITRLLDRSRLKKREELRKIKSAEHDASAWSATCGHSGPKPSDAREPKISTLTEMDEIVENVDVCTHVVEPVFDSQSFEYFALALERSGHSDKATELRIAKRSAEIEKNSNWLSALGYDIAWAINGYGYRNERAIYFLFGLIVFGAFVHFLGRSSTIDWPRSKRTINVWGDQVAYSASYSVDRLVSQLQLDQEMNEYSKLRPWARYYFYIHRMLGAVLLVFVIAGLTGVLK